MKRLFKFIHRSKKTVLLIVVVAAATMLVTTLTAMLLRRITDLSVPGFGTITTLGVEAYWNNNLTNRTEAINFGRILFGSSENVTLYLRSISNIETTLNLTTRNWTFFDSNSNIVAGPNNTTPYMNLTWNYNKTIVRPGETLQVMLTLSIAGSAAFFEFLTANDVKTFSVDIHISTSEHS